MELSKDDILDIMKSKSGSAKDDFSDSVLNKGLMGVMAVICLYVWTTTNQSKDDITILNSEKSYLEKEVNYLRTEVNFLKDERQDRYTEKDNVKYHTPILEQLDNNTMKINKIKENFVIEVGEIKENINTLSNNDEKVVYRLEYLEKQK